ncbi:amidohydrolase family protein [Ruegeria sp. HKCCD4884]|uniref:amidohydrolase family protein n=1 Tax=Ruegeria sp. HKCCD4884 TaxID=2683022 RepID=UPI001491A325|nr:amidohydrolase family protein [Ruegeria sp. HKCCD4884]NOD93098.1 amidohydrolase family protein [Ruegeria sp. HKCCD4884]
MSNIRITNCHTHLFHARHVPEDYPYPALKPFKKMPWLIKALAFGARLIGQHSAAEKLDRLYRFQQETDAGSQRDILDNMRRHYPSDTRFVVLPMEMSAFGFGAPEVPLSAQHDELAKLSGDPDVGRSVIPFATIDPRADPQATELWRAIDGLKFRGLKLYPRLGFAPDDPVLMQHVYPRLEELNLPVMSHCSRGGVQGRYLSDYWADRYTEPEAFIPVMRAHPKLRICLAHFGGQRDWDAYVNPDRKNPLDDAFNRNWQVAIRRMIGSGNYPGLWADISYTLFQFEDYAPFLRIFLTGEDEESERLRSRVLFGSDYYMTRQEALSEKAVCFRLRNILGEEIFRQIAEENPAKWLGEA